MNAVSNLISGENTDIVSERIFLIVSRYPVAIMSVYLLSRHNSDLVNNVTQNFTKKFLNPTYRFSQDEFIRFSLTEVEHIVNTVFAPLLLMLLEIVIVFFGLVQVIRTLSPILYTRPALFLLFFLIILVLLWFFVKSMRMLGKNRQIVQKERFRVVNQAFDSRWLLFSLKHLASKQWDAINRAFGNYARISRNSQTMQQMPRYVFEGTFIFVLGLLLYVYNVPISSLVVVLILGTRLLPSFMKVLSSFQTTMFGLKALEEFKEKTEGFVSNEVIANKRHVKALNSMLNDSKGIIEIRGDSGSGKSTLLKRIFLDNSVESCMLPQPVSLPDPDLPVLLKSIEISDQKELQAIWYKIFPRNLSEKPDWDNLSGGERTRLGFLEVCLSAHRIILLDEPDTGLDETNANLVKKAIELLSEHKLIIVVSHTLEFNNSTVVCL